MRESLILVSNMEQPKPEGSPLEILEICKISPSPSPPHEFSLPLTFFDLIFFIDHPAQKLHFYSFPLQPNFNSILKNLKHSLSLTLSHFLPYVGNIVWPNHSPQPFILYKPGDSISLTIAKTNADFNHLSANHVRKANESHFLVPDLPTSDTVAPALSLQITLFPNRGLCIGLTINHVVSDARTLAMFLKSWAFICSSNNNNNLPTLPLELTPVFDRSAINDPNGLQALYVKHFKTFLPNPKTFSFPTKVEILDDVMRGTFELKRTDIENLRNKVVAASSSSSTRRLTTFVLTFAYVSTCIVKAQSVIEPDSKICLSFYVDWRARVETLGGLNYFGNGISGYVSFYKGRDFEGENGMVIVANKISDLIAEIEENVKGGKFVEMLEGNSREWRKEMPISKVIVVAGSPRVGFYDVDFGWGGCEKVETVSIKSGQSFLMAESRNGNGGVEVTIVLPSEEMKIFCSLFYEGVKNYVN